VKAPYYEDDLVTLYHGDCREIAAWLAADVLVTDPPYGISYASHGVAMTSRADRKRGDFNGKSRASKSIANDKTTEARDAALALWGQKPAIVFGSLLIAPPAGTKQTAVFVKALDSGNLTSIGGIRRDVEAIYLLGNHTSGGGGRTAVFRTNAHAAGSPHGYVARAGGHPHTKPQDVMQELIGLTEGVIADPFTGGGQHVGCR
jgi:hypothetical protein